MNWVSHTLRSTIGSKVLMALSGLMMVGFLLAHLSGNLLVFAGPEALNHYAERLRDYLPVLWFLRIGLIAAVVVHIATAWRLTCENRAARPQPYQMKRPVKASLASRNMGLSGSVVLAFICYHLAHLTFRWTHPEFATLGHFDVYQMMMLSFRSPFVSGFYILAIILLMLHLNHGISSFFQTMGLNHPKYKLFVNCFGPALSVILGCGFLSIPLAILLGFIH